MRVAGILSSAIVGRELRRTARLRSTYVVRAVYLSLLIGIVALIWAGLGPSGRTTNVAVMSTVGRELYTAFFLLEMILALLVCPILLCGAIADETEDRTIEVLLTAPIGRLALVMSKFVSRMAFAVALLLASIPVMMGCLTMGGVAPLEVWMASLLVLGMGGWAGAVTLFFSTLVRKGFAAALLTHFLILGWSIGIPMCATVLSGFTSGPSAATVLFAPPIFFLFLVSGDPGYSALLWPELGVLAGASLAFLWLASRFVGRGLTRAVPREAAAQTAPSRETRLLGTVGWCVMMALLCGFLLMVMRVLLPDSYQEGFAAAPGPFLVCLVSLAWALARGIKAFFCRGRGYRPVWEDPFLWKEIALEGPLAGRVSTTLVVGAIAVIGILCLPDARVARSPDAPSSLANLMLGIMLVVTSVVGASGVTSEREQGLLDLLLVSPVTPRRFLDGKLWGALAQTWPMGLFFLAYGASAVALGSLPSVGGFCLGVLVVAANLYFQGALACTLSLCLRRSTTAILTALAVPFALFAGWPLLCVLAEVDGSGARFFLTFQDNPFFFLTALLLGADDSEVRDYAIGFYPGLILHIAAFVGLGYALRAWAAANFHRWARLGLE